MGARGGVSGSDSGVAIRLGVSVDINGEFRRCDLTTCQAGVNRWSVRCVPRVKPRVDCLGGRVQIRYPALVVLAVTVAACGSSGGKSSGSGAGPEDSGKQ